MKRPQWITVGIAVLLVVVLYATTVKQVFGPTQVSKPLTTSTNTADAISTDSILYHAKEHLTPEQLTRINMLEHSISRGDVHDQQLHVFHELSRFWRDSAGSFGPFAWYTAEAARLENSEKSLTFAARLFLNRLIDESDPRIKSWEAGQAKDLFERSLKINPASDSSKVGLGSVFLFGGVDAPMQGIGMIREVADRDSTNVYAQWTLGQASLYSGQLDKATERFKRIARMQPNNVDAVLLVAETAERMGNNAEAVEWYSKSLPSLSDTAIKKEVEARIAKLKK
jgi:tetratricopeptide (TPR) repeat protein